MNTSLFLLLMRMGSGTTPTAIRFQVTGQAVYVPGDSARNVFRPGDTDSQVFVPGDVKRKVVT